MLDPIAAAAVAAANEKAACPDPDRIWQVGDYDLLLSDEAEEGSHLLDQAVFTSVKQSDHHLDITFG